MNIRLAFRNLSRNLRRTMAILLTVMAGSGALFLFQGFIHGVLSEYKENSIHTQYGHGQIHTEGYRDSAHKKPWEHWIDNSKSIEAYLLKQEEVERVFPRVTFGALLKNGSKSVNGMGQGVNASEERAFFHSLNFIQGHNLADEASGIVLGKGLAEALDVAPGDTITAYAQSTKRGFVKDTFVVTGIFHTGAAEFDNTMFRVQLAKAQNMLKTNRVEKIALGLKDERSWEVVAQKVAQRYPKLESVSFEELDVIYYKHSVQWLNAQFYMLQTIILSMVLLGIFNSISTSILERKQEIGNLRANGESRVAIAKMIAFEGAVLGLLGALLGIGVSYVFKVALFSQGVLMPPGPGLTRQSAIHFAFTQDMMWWALIVGVGSSLIAALLAGLKVVRIPIAQALRDEG